MNYLDIFTCHKTVLKAFINIPATPPVASLLQGVNLCSKGVYEKKHHFLKFTAAAISKLLPLHTMKVF